MSKLLSMMMESSGGGRALNATIVGNPIVSSDFVVSNFYQNSYTSTTGNYLIANLNEDLAPLANKKFNFTIKFKPYSAPTQDYNYMGITGFYNNNSPLYVWLTKNNKIGITYTSDIGTTAVLNTWNWLRFYNDGSFNTYIIQTSLDGETFTTTYTAGLYKIQKNFPIGRVISTSNFAGSAFNGEIDMKETFIEYDNNMVWQGVI